MGFIGKGGDRYGRLRTARAAGFNAVLETSKAATNHPILDAPGLKHQL